MNKAEMYKELATRAILAEYEGLIQEAAEAGSFSISVPKLMDETALRAFRRAGFKISSGWDDTKYVTMIIWE